MAAMSLLVGCSAFVQRTPEERRGRAMADAMMDAMGGRRAWNRLRYLHFTLEAREGDRVVERRTYFWDRQTGRVRLEGIRDGQPFTTLLNLDSGEGMAYQNNQPVAQARQSATLRSGSEHFKLDSPWLSPAVLLTLPSVQPEDLGERTIEGRSCPTLFIYVPADPSPRRDLQSRLYSELRNWIAIDPETGRPLTSALTQPVSDRPALPAPTVYFYRQWTELGGIWFPTRMESRDGSRTIAILDHYTRDEMSDRVFMTLSGTE